MDKQNVIGASFFMDNNHEKNRIRSVIRHTAFGSHPSVLQVSPRVRPVTPSSGVATSNEPRSDITSQSAIFSNSNVGSTLYRHPNFTVDPSHVESDDSGEDDKELAKINNTNGMTASISDGHSEITNTSFQKQATRKVVKIADILSIGVKKGPGPLSHSNATSNTHSVGGTPQSQYLEGHPADGKMANVSFGLNDNGTQCTTSETTEEARDGSAPKNEGAPVTQRAVMFDPLLTPALQPLFCDEDFEEHQHLNRQLPNGKLMPRNESTSGFVVIDSLSQALGEPAKKKRIDALNMTDSSGQVHTGSARSEAQPSNASFNAAAPLIGSLFVRRSELEAAEIIEQSNTTKRKAEAAAKAKLLDKLRKGTALSPAQQRKQLGEFGEGLTHTFSDTCPEMARIEGQVVAPLYNEDDDEEEEGEGEGEVGSEGNDQQHLSASTANNAASPLRTNDFSPAENWATMRRLGFPCSVRSEVVEAEYLAQMTLMNEVNVCDYHWNLSLRGVAILGSATVETCEHLRKLSRKYGIPSHLRHLMWMTLSGVSLKMDENEGFFKVISEKFGLVSGPSQEVIEKDLERTFPDHPYFGPGEPGVHRLRLILHALCWRNPLLGYCQSFNFIAAILLLVLNDDEGTFFMMCHILESLLPNDYYSEGLMGVKIDQKVFVLLLEELLPRVAQHFDDIRFDVRAIIPAWLMSLYVNTFPVETLLRIWDYMVTERSSLYSTVPMTIALAFLKIRQDEILRTRDPGDMMVLLNTKALCEYDGARLVKTAHEFELKPSVLHNHRRRVREDILIETEKRRRAREQFEAERKSRLQALAVQKAAEALAAGGTSATGSPHDGIGTTPSSPTNPNKSDVRQSGTSSPTNITSPPALLVTNNSSAPNRNAQPHGHDKIAASEGAKKGPPSQKRVQVKPLHHTDPNHPSNATSRKTYIANVVEMKDYGPAQLALPSMVSDKTEKGLAASMSRQ